MVGFSSIFRYFLQVVVVGSTRNYVCRLGTLWFLLQIRRKRHDLILEYANIYSLSESTLAVYTLAFQHNAEKEVAK